MVLCKLDVAGIKTHKLTASYHCFLYLMALLLVQGNNLVEANNITKCVNPFTCSASP